MRWLGSIAVAVVLLLGSAPGGARAGDRFDPLKKAEEAAKDKLPKEDPEAARLAKLKRDLAGKPARVVVLRTPGSKLDASDTALRAAIEVIIGKAGATFVDEVDIAQQGRIRKEIVGREDRILPPKNQPGRVPQDQIDYVRSEVGDLQKRLRDADRRNRDTSDVAGDLLDLVRADPIWFDDGPATRKVLFELYLTLGQAAAGLPEQVSPYYQKIETRSDNYYLYQAAAMIWEERQVGRSDLAKLVPAAAQREVDRILGMIDRGDHPTMWLSFQSNLIDPETLVKEYRVVINGLERPLEAHEGELMIEVPRGRVDVSLEHKGGGFGLSHRVELVLQRGEEPPILELARQDAGRIQRELVHHVNECERQLAPEEMAGIAVYAAIHPKEDVYVAVAGANLRELDVWRWNRESQELHKVLDATRGFALRFAFLATAGMSFGGGSVSTAGLQPAPGDTTLRLPTSSGELLRFDAMSVPVDLQLRAHWHRLLVGFGVSVSANVGTEGKWRDRHTVPDDRVVVDRDALAAGTATEVPNEQTWNRLIYGTLGVVLLKHAPLGLGPRAYVRVGGLNVPHAIDLTGHVGFTYDPSFGKKPPTGRFAALLDFDAYGGVRIPYGQTLYQVDPPGSDGPKPYVLPNVGFSVGAGWSF